MYEKYLEICDELALQPATDTAWDSIGTVTDITVVEIRDANGHATWGAIDGQNRWGCRDCLQSAADLLSVMYDGFEKETYDAAAAGMLIERFWALHTLPLALTNGYEPQNWSVIFPVPSCETCRTVVDARMIADFFDKPQPAAAEAPNTDTRAVAAASFVGRNRIAVGFAAIVGNPVFVDEEPSAALFNAPVRTDLKPQDCDIAGGKGVDEDHGLASFVGEALERYALTGVFSSAPLVASFDVATEAVDPAEEFGFPVLDSHTSIRPYAPSLEIEWTWSSDSRSHRRAVPSNLVMSPYKPRHERAAVISSSSTNGAAGGATAQDAYVHSLMEIVERDAFWYYARSGRMARTIPSIAGWKSLRH